MCELWSYKSKGSKSLICEEEDSSRSIRSSVNIRSSRSIMKIRNIVNIVNIKSSRSIVNIRTIVNIVNNWSIKSIVNIRSIIQVRLDGKLSLKNREFLVTV